MCTARKSAGANSLVFAQELDDGWARDVTALIGINAWPNEMFTLNVHGNVHAESVNSLFCLFCFFDVTIFVGSKRRRTCLWLGCDGDRMTLPFIGSRLVLVRYSIYPSIAILVNVRYRYLMVSRYFDISNDQTILGRYFVRSAVSTIVPFTVDMEALPENLDIAIPTTDSSIINTSD